MDKILIKESELTKIYIRDLEDAQILSIKTIEVLENGRKARNKEAVNDNDMLYLTNIFDYLTTIDIFRILFAKYRKRFS